ncbi:MAG: hypothetical protein F4073_11225 [Rhodobacteraceae bacterium]|nr:hypothetical protein [Gemmatimonadota bacterium]MYF46175.1 hypothetical protein [Paracoccaceae bacterium]MYI92504.1 hypothetical protein [Paracoccaceae bacterium]
MRFTLVKIVLAIFLSTSTAFPNSLIDSQKGMKSDSFVKAFLSLCAHSIGQYDRTLEMSKIYTQQEIPEEFITGLRPADPKAEFVGYVLMDIIESPLVFGVSRGEIGGEVLVSCTVSNPFISVDAVAKDLEMIANLGEPDYDKSEMGQRYRLWNTNFWVQGSFILMTDISPMNEDGVTLGIIGPIDD